MEEVGHSNRPKFTKFDETCALNICREYDNVYIYLVCWFSYENWNQECGIKLLETADQTETEALMLLKAANIVTYDSSIFL